MLSNWLSPRAALGIKIVALIVALLAAATGLLAARLWIRASVIDLPVFDPPVASIGDAPEVHVMSTMVQLNETADALRQANALNAAAARWTAIAAILTGLAALLGVF